MIPTRHLVTLGMTLGMTLIMTPSGNYSTRDIPSNLLLP